MCNSSGDSTSLTQKHKWPAQRALYVHVARLEAQLSSNKMGLTQTGRERRAQHEKTVFMEQAGICCEQNYIAIPRTVHQSEQNKTKQNWILQFPEWGRRLSYFLVNSERLGEERFSFFLFFFSFLWCFPFFDLFFFSFFFSFFWYFCFFCFEESSSEELE